MDTSVCKLPTPVDDGPEMLDRRCNRRARRISCADLFCAILDSALQLPATFAVHEEVR